MDIDGVAAFSQGGGGALVALFASACDKSPVEEPPTRLRDAEQPVGSGEEPEDANVAVSEPDEGSPPPLAALSWVGSDVPIDGTLEVVAIPAAGLVNETGETAMYRTRWYSSAAEIHPWSEFEQLPPSGEVALEPTEMVLGSIADSPELPSLLRLSVQIVTAGGASQTLISDEVFVQSGEPMTLVGSRYFSDVLAPQLAPGLPTGKYAGARIVSISPAAAKIGRAEDFEALLAAASEYQEVGENEDTEGMEE